MKNTFTLLTACLVICAACGKSGDRFTKDNGCVEQVTVPAPAHSINPAMVPTINNLFSKNGIDNSRFRYYRVTHDTLQTQYPPFTKYDRYVIRVDQYTNGVRIFYGEMIFHFLNDSLSYQSDNLTKGTTLDTVPKLSIRQLRKLFLDDLQRFDNARNKYNGVCFKCEFGYYNLNIGKHNAPEQLVKAWRVTPKDHEYPVAFYKDDNRGLIRYDNGIIIN